MESHPSTTYGADLNMYDRHIAERRHLGHAFVLAHKWAILRGMRRPNGKQGERRKADLRRMNARLNQVLNEERERYKGIFGEDCEDEVVELWMQQHGYFKAFNVLKPECDWYKRAHLARNTSHSGRGSETLRDEWAELTVANSEVYKDQKYTDLNGNPIGAKKKILDVKNDHAITPEAATIRAVNKYKEDAFWELGKTAKQTSQHIYSYQVQLVPGYFPGPSSSKTNPSSHICPISSITVNPQPLFPTLDLVAHRHDPIFRQHATWIELIIGPAQSLLPYTFTPSSMSNLLTTLQSSNSGLRLMGWPYYGNICGDINSFIITLNDSAICNRLLTNGIIHNKKIIPVRQLHCHKCNKYGHSEARCSYPLLCLLCGVCGHTYREHICHICGIHRGCEHTEQVPCLSCWKGHTVSLDDLFFDHAQRIARGDSVTDAGVEAVGASGA